MLVSALMMAAALVASDQDGVVATAPATSVDLTAATQPVAPSVIGATQEAAPHGLTTDQQIDRWLSDRDPAAVPYADGGAPVAMQDDREMHGQLSFGIGTGGYRDYGAAVSLPIGDNARLNLSYRQIENGYYPYGYGYGYGPYSEDVLFGIPERSKAGAAYELESRGMRATRLPPLGQ
ncbi:hypothetical protein [Brevundimonas lenta]|uniref:Uncharacterized protein n=1 Tax=Brevundimonas lenta TaxID=424796 RepID=A0A7W6JCB5_9CAUL|nr:hypothetical protein [Brevundimonas lenta]MBB4082510.1 hypothetical protein [Brevundimonas lenta]